LRNFGIKGVEEILLKLKNKCGVELDEDGKLAKTLNKFEGLETLDNNKGLNTTIDKMDLSVRSCKCLNRAGKDTVSDLVGMTKEDLMRIRNFGIKCVEEVLLELKNGYGVEFNENGVLVSTRVELEVEETVGIIVEEEIAEEPIDIFEVEKEKISELEAIVAEHEKKREEWFGDSIFLEDVRKQSTDETTLQRKMQEKSNLGNQLEEATEYANGVKHTLENMLGEEKTHEDS
ncbi:MAG: hypothetical protein FWC68_06130, partial [Oscillospiraceae bacterium]|nr:hypothetical protein [Oscillospiraceae bacterium]